MSNKNIPYSLNSQESFSKNLSSLYNTNKLSKIRILQKNIVYIIGLPLNLASKELLYPKYKFSYTEQEKIRLKRLIIFSPPPIEIRRKVRLKNKNFNLLINNIKIVMAQSIRSST